MRIRYWVVALACVVALCCPAITHAATRTSMPLGSFITKSVNSPEELAKQIEQDKKVAQRYSRHFGIGAKEMAEYVRKNLRVAQLKSSGRYTTYYTTRSDRILVHSKNFKAGRRVFISLDGKPVLDLACGNPLVKSLPKVVVKVQPQKTEVVTKPVPPAQPPPPPVQETPTVVDELPTAPPQVETPVTEAPQMAQNLNTPVPETAVLDMPPMEFTSAASLLSRGVLPGLLTAAAASAVLGKDSSPPPPVPEPTGLLVLGSSSLAGLASCLRMRNRHVGYRKR